MKKVLEKILLIIVLIIIVISLSGCTLKIETTENSVSASVDKETAEKAGGIIEWIKEQLEGIFKKEDTQKSTEPVIRGESQIV